MFGACVYSCDSLTQFLKIKGCLLSPKELADAMIVSAPPPVVMRSNSVLTCSL